MKLKKSIIIGFIILLLFITANLIWRASDMYLKRSVINFSKIIKTGNIDDLSLTIYYLSPYMFTPYPFSVDDVIRTKDFKIIVSGSELKEHIDLLSQINKDILIPVENKSDILDARLYYVFETKKGLKILDVTMWGDDESIFLNGFEIKSNDIFYDVIMPFLPEDAVTELEPYKTGDR